MPDVKTEDREQVLQAERSRVKYIREMGKKFSREDLAQKHIDEGTDADEFRMKLLVELGDAREVTHEQMQRETAIGMSDKDKKRYSLFRHIEAIYTRDWTKAGFEREMALAQAERDGKGENTNIVPYDVLRSPYASQLDGKRDINYGSGSGAGAALVGTEHLAGDMIEMLRPASVLAKMGIRVMDGLRGNIEIPRRDTGATFYVIDNETTGVTESSPSFGLISARPRSVAGRVDLTRRMMQQSSPAVEGLTRDDLVLGMGTKVDQLGLIAAGSGEDPTGILYQSGIGSVVGGTNGAALAWSHIIDLKTKVAAKNALRGKPGYVFSPTVGGYCQKTEKVASTAQFLMMGDGSLAGYPVGQTTLMPDTLTKGTSSGVCSAILFGNFDDAILFMWGGLELKVDEITLADYFGLVLRIVMDLDFGVRHAESFAAMLDALAS